MRPAPIVKRPYESLYNPYPLGCSKLCNHPIDKDLKREYKEVLRKTKENLVRIFFRKKISSNFPQNCSILKKTLTFFKKKIAKKIETHGSILLPEEEEILVREELRRLASTPDSEFSDINRPDSAHLEDDEDRIPEEQLLKYTKPDSPVPQLEQSKLKRQTSSPHHPGSTISTSRPSPSPRPHSGSTRRSKTPDQLHEES